METLITKSLYAHHNNFNNIYYKIIINLLFTILSNKFPMVYNLITINFILDTFLRISCFVKYIIKSLISMYKNT